MSIICILFYIKLGNSDNNNTEHINGINKYKYDMKEL